MPSIEAREVTVVRSGKTLLDAVSLSVPDARTLAIVGPPAGGKSLLLQVLVGLVQPDDGAVLIDGEDVTASRPRKRDVSMMFQDFALLPKRDVYDNLTLAAYLKRRHDPTEIGDRITEFTDLMGLGELLDSYPDELDDQLSQRVAAGRSLVRDAQAYLLDDPFAAQSDRLRPHVRSVLLQWQRERARTTIITTSDIDEALSSADHVAVLHQGFVHQVGTPRELYEQPADMFVAGYLGSPPMNLIPGFPVPGGVDTPLGHATLADEVMTRIGDREVVVLGIRPEHIGEGDAGAAFTFDADVHDVEWRGRTQFAYVGYDIDPEIEAVLAEVEQLIEFDLFQSFVMAELPADRSLEAGKPVSLSVAAHNLHLFDPITGVNLLSEEATDNDEPSTTVDEPDLDT